MPESPRPLTQRVWADRGVGAKIAFVLAVALAAGLVTGLAGVSSVDKLARIGNEINDTVPEVTALQTIALTAKAAANDERGFLLAGDPSFIDEVDEKLGEVDEAVQAAVEASTDEDRAARIADVGAAIGAWGDALQQEFTLYKVNRQAAVNIALGANRELRKSYEEDLAAVTEDAVTSLEQGERFSAEASSTTVRLLVILAIGLLVSILAGRQLTRQIVRGVRRQLAALQAVAGGDLTAEAEVNGADEVGQMATALNTATAHLRQAMGQMDANAQALASASEELSSVSGQMAGSASESSSQAGLVSAAAEQVSRNVQTVATGTEEMSASIREIAHNATNAAGVAAQAVGVAESTNATVAKLGESSAEVGNVIKVINSIAGQTNLLALNATIEAARAGEAGKGFAVVANEVKELAQETSKATEDISRRIEAIQSDTTAAVAAIGEIAGIIGQINDTQTTIASAVEEQTATTNEMSRNVAEAATGSTDIAQNITGVARSASDTQLAAGSTSQAAEELARMAAQMRVLVGQFSY